MISHSEVLWTALFIPYMECDTTKSMSFKTGNPEAAKTALDFTYLGAEVFRNARLN